MSQAGPVLSGEIDPSIPTIFETDSGIAFPLFNTIRIVGGSGIDTSGSGDTVTISGEDASYTNKGIASFDQNNFTVTNGHVVLNITPSAITLTGNSGFATETASNINVVGNVASGISTTGSLSNLSLILSNIPNYSLANSSITLNNGNNINVTGNPVSLGGAATFNLTGTTNNSVQIGNASGSLTSLSVGTNGQVLLGSTGSAPVFATLTSSDGSVTFTTGAGTLSLQVSGGTTVGKTITGDSGGILSPTLGNWNLFGSGSITTSGSGSTLTTQLQGLTNHAVLVGAGTTTITKIAATANTGAVLQNNSGADPSYSTATYPSTTTINQILYSNAANTVTGLATTNKAVLTTGTTGIPVLTAIATDGQLIIGSTAGAPAAGNITSTGGTVIVSNNSNNINLEIVPQTNSFARIMLMMGG